MSYGTSELVRVLEPWYDETSFGCMGGQRAFHSRLKHEQLQPHA
jgi:hypothetical protein